MVPQDTLNALSAKALSLSQTRWPDQDPTVMHVNRLTVYFRPEDPNNAVGFTASVRTIVPAKLTDAQLGFVHEASDPTITSQEQLHQCEADIYQRNPSDHAWYMTGQRSTGRHYKPRPKQPEGLLAPTTS